MTKEDILHKHAGGFFGIFRDEVKMEKLLDFKQAILKAMDEYAAALSPSVPNGGNFTENDMRQAFEYYYMHPFPHQIKFEDWFNNVYRVSNRPASPSVDAETEKQRFVNIMKERLKEFDNPYHKHPYKQLSEAIEAVIELIPPDMFSLSESSQVVAKPNPEDFTTRGPHDQLDFDGASYEDAMRTWQESQVVAAEKEKYCDAMGHYGGDPLPMGNCPKCGKPWALSESVEVVPTGKKEEEIN